MSRKGRVGDKEARKKGKSGRQRKMKEGGERKKKRMREGRERRKEGRTIFQERVPNTDGTERMDVRMLERPLRGAP